MYSILTSGLHCTTMATLIINIKTHTHKKESYEMKS